MSDFMLNLVDGRRAIHAEVDGEIADTIVGALGAEPETIEELEAAMARFVKPKPGVGFFDNWSSGTREEPNDAGLFVIDLSARLVAGRSPHWLLEPSGRVAYHDGTSATKVRVSYTVPKDWVFSEEVEGWRAAAERIRCDTSPRCDSRRVLYEKVVEYIVSECLAAAERGAQEDPAAEIHARWMLTPRDDLLGASPRDVLLDKREFIDWDLEDRASQWSRMGVCPPGLAAESAAFRLGGFGTHEIVLYYELLRRLLHACWNRLVERPKVDEAEEVERLRRLKADWLRTPQREELDGFSPAHVISLERSRIPLAVSGEHAMVDDDCPLCQMLADQSSPAFWHLDGCNMEEDFAFSFHETRAEWEEEHRYWEELSRSWNESRTRQGAQKPSPGKAAADSRVGENQAASVWTRSFSYPDAIQGLPEGQAREVMLFGVGGCLAELGLDLKTSPAAGEWAGTLNRDFGNLREAVRGASGGLVEPVVERFCDDLASVAEARPDLADKCADLERQLHIFVERAPAS